MRASLSVLVTADRDKAVLSDFMLRIREFFLARNLAGQLVVVDALAAYPEPPGEWSLLKSTPDIQCDWVAMDVPRDQVEALMQGLLQVRSSIVVIMDSDMADNIDDIDRFLALHRGGCDLVFAWRIERQGVGYVRRSLTTVFNRIVRSSTGLPLHDLNAPMLSLSERARLAVHAAAKAGPSARLQVCHLLRESLGEVPIKVSEVPGKASSYTWWNLLAVGIRRLREILAFVLARRRP